MASNSNPEVITVVVGETIIQTTMKHKPLTEESLTAVLHTILEKQYEIREAVGGNWFPCGFAHLWVEGRSPLVKFVKKHGKKHDNDRYDYGSLYIWKAYGSGYTVQLHHLADDPVSVQSLNFKTPLYQLLQKLLAFVGVSSELRTRVD